MRVVYLHSHAGSPREHWAPSLKRRAQSLGATFVGPQLPVEGTFDDWEKMLDAQDVALEDAIVVAYGMGVPFVLARAEKEKMKALLLVAMPPPDDASATFMQRTFDYPAIKENAERIVFFHADDDPRMPLYAVLALRTPLSAELHIVRGGGLLDAQSGYTEFPALERTVEDLIQRS